MGRKILSLLPCAAAVLILLTCTACLERTEEITIDEDGSARITTTLSGPEDTFGALMAYPSEPEWTIVEETAETHDGDMKIVAEMTVPYGKPMPHTFAKADNPQRDIHLQFPSEIKFWTEGSRTYYEFKRTYNRRQFRCINLSKHSLWDQDLEDRVLENGIFEASEQDRESYLQQFVTGFSYMHWRFLWETLGQMVRSGDISPAAKGKVETAAFTHLEDVITPVRILGILGKDDEAMGEALDNMTEELHASFAGIFASITGPDETEAQQKFADLFALVAREYSISETLGGHEFFVGLHMPGTVIIANGLVDPEKPGSVEWYFMGDDLYDADFPLYALSVLER